MVTLSRDAKADTLLDLPFTKGEIAAPGTYCDTLPQVPQHASHQVSQGKFILKHVENIKYLIFTGIKYKVLTLNMYKNKALSFYLHY